MSAHKKDYIFYGLVLLLAGIFLAYTPQIQSANKTSILGPKSWPTMILVLMVVISIMGIIRTFMASKIAKEQDGAKVNDEENVPESRYRNLPMSLVSTGFIVLYAIGVYFLGFIISTFLFMFSLTQVLGAKNKIVLLIVGVFVTALFVWLFSIVLKVPLPRGVGFFREFSLRFY